MTEQIKLAEYDKSRWKKGEWDTEPDRVDFIHSGFSCMLIRNLHGNWCGYVGVPSTHSAHGKDYDDVNVDVHGGLTYADKCRGHICHVPEPGMPDDVWWLGFDTAHSGDLSPSEYLNFGEDDGTTYKNVEYARNETAQLAEQLEAMK